MGALVDRVTGGQGPHTGKDVQSQHQAADAGIHVQATGFGVPEASGDRYRKRIPAERLKAATPDSPLPIELLGA